MFEKIFIKQNRISENTIDLGKLCESLLFYKQTNFLLDKFTIGQFIKLVEFNKLKEYNERGILKLHIRNSAIGTAKIIPNGNNCSYYSPIVTESSAFNLEELIFKEFKDVTKSEKEAKTNTKNFLDICTYLEYSADFQNVLNSECEDIDLLNTQLKIYINSYFPQLELSDLKIDIEDKIRTQWGSDAYVFKSNYDFEDLNKKYSELLPKGDLLNWSSFILSFTESSGDINIASQYDSEIYSDDKHTLYIQGRFNELIKKVTNSSNNIQTFESLALENYKPIRDTINSGERSFEEFSKIIDKSFEFRGWLNHLDGNNALLNEYYQAITKENWIDSKPVKAIRFLFFTALGIVGDMLAGGLPIGSLSSSVSDNYLLPKIANGWKPNQFIDNQIKTFLPQKNIP